MKPVAYEEHGFFYIRISDIPVELRSEFEAFIAYQTRPLIESLNPQDAAYLGDWNRFQRLKSGKSIAWD